MPPQGLQRKSEPQQTPSASACTTKRRPPYIGNLEWLIATKHFTPKRIVKDASELGEVRLPADSIQSPRRIFKIAMAPNNKRAGKVASRSKVSKSLNRGLSQYSEANHSQVEQLSDDPPRESGVPVRSQFATASPRIDTRLPGKEKTSAGSFRAPGRSRGSIWAPERSCGTSGQKDLSDSRPEIKYGDHDKEEDGRTASVLSNNLEILPNPFQSENQHSMKAITPRDAKGERQDLLTQAPHSEVAPLSATLARGIPPLSDRAFDGSLLVEFRNSGSQPEFTSELQRNLSRTTGISRSETLGNEDSKITESMIEIGMDAARNF